MPRTAPRPGHREPQKRTSRLRGVLVAAALVLATLTAPLLTASPAEADTLCKTTGGGLPSGWVIVGEFSTASCSGSYPNAWDMRRPSDTTVTTICKTVSSAPYGFVILSQGNGACPGTYPNVYNIARPSTSTSTAICSWSTVPDGWVVTSRFSSGACPGSDPNGLTIVPKNPTTTSPPSGTTTAIRGVGSGRCMDVPNGNFSFGNQVQLWDCNGTLSQSWTYTSYRELHIYRKGCLEATGTTAGSPVKFNGCYSRTSEHWNFRSDGSITDDRSGLCLDATGGYTTNGTKLQMWPCNGTVAQQWIRG